MRKLPNRLAGIIILLCWVAALLRKVTEFNNSMIAAVIAERELAYEQTAAETASAQ